MSALTLIRFLIGSREAILKVADAKGALWLGLLFVLSAGFAREYDAEDLLAEPWHLLLPLAASLVSSAVLYLLVSGVAFLRGERDRAFFRTYLRFLSIFWMTAPLAWVYAIPVERFLSPADAVAANFALLGMVALWRVVLITRVVSVLYQCHFFSAFLIVMLFGSVVLQIAIWYAPTPILLTMGGARLSEADALVRDAHFHVSCLNIMSMPVWLLGTMCVAANSTLPRMSFPPAHSQAGEGTKATPLPAWKFDTSTWRVVLPADDQRRVGWHVCSFALAALAVWLPLLLLTQPEQRNRRRVELLLAEEEFEQAVRYISARKPGDFPPHWDPPPRLGYGERVPGLWRILIALHENDAPKWIRDVYIEKISTQGYRLIELWLDEMDDEEFARYAAAIKESETNSRVIIHHALAVRRSLRHGNISKKRSASLDEMAAWIRRDQYAREFLDSDQ